MKEEQKQHLIDIIEKDEELGLYDIFNEEKRQGVKELIDKHKLEEASWKFNPLKKLDGEFLRHAFKEGAKWQQERSYSREEIFPLVDMLDQCKDYFFLKKDKNTVDTIANIFKKLKIK